MNLGDGESQTVEFSPAFPYHGAFFFRTNQAGSCANQYKLLVKTVLPLFQIICCGYRKPIRKSPSSTSRVNTLACQTYAIWRLGTNAKASDQSARVSDEIDVFVLPSVRRFM